MENWIAYRDLETLGLYLCISGKELVSKENFLSQNFLHKVSTEYVVLNRLCLSMKTFKTSMYTYALSNFKILPVL